LTGVQLVSSFEAMNSNLAPVKIDAQRRVIPDGDKRRVAYWRVTLGRRITRGSKIRRFFKSYADAKKFLADSLASKVEQASEAFAIAPELRVEAKQCQERLALAGLNVGRMLTLTEAVTFFLRHALPQGGTRTFSEAIEAFLASRRAMHCKERYLVNLRSQLTKAENAFGKKRVNLLTQGALESWLAEQEFAPKTKNNYIITLRALLNYCVEQKWTAENVAGNIAKAKLNGTDIGVFTVAESARLLAAAQQCDEGFGLAAVVIQLFAGLRRSEVCVLDWSEVRPNVIEVTAGKAKTRSRRVVEIQANLAEWLAPLRRKSGRVFTGTEDAYNQLLHNILTRANQSGAEQEPKSEAIEWKHNSLRHTCASMHLAYFENEAATALQMGHSVEVLHSFYKGLVTKETAEPFWNLRPAARDTNGISFANRSHGRPARRSPRSPTGVRRSWRTRAI
jgi:integrase